VLNQRANALWWDFGVISMGVVNIGVLSRYDPVLKRRFDLLWLPASIAEVSEPGVWPEVQLRHRTLFARTIDQFQMQLPRLHRIEQVQFRCLSESSLG